MVKKSAKSPKAKPVKKATAVKKATTAKKVAPAKKAAKSTKGAAHVNELRSAAKASAIRRLNK